MKKNTILLRCFLFGCAYYAQFAQGQSRPITIKGMVVDSASGKALEQASISLIKSPGSITIRQTLSGRAVFLLRYVPVGKYQLITSYIGYKNDTASVVVTNLDTIFTVNTIRLQKVKSELMEVVVKTIIPPVIIKNDTLVFNANNYKTRPNATVEDLVKRMPGIEVDKDGNITMQGQKVDKVYIDGREFFLRDPKSATQTLSADMIAQVEVFDSQSDKAKFLRVKDADGNKTINLKLKKDKKNLLTLKAYAGYGNQQRYAVGARGNQFGSGPWIDGGFHTNNANNAITSRGDAKNGLGAGVQTHTGYDFTYGGMQPGKRFNASIDYEGAHTNIAQVSESQRKTFLGDSSLLENRLHTGNTRTDNNLLDAVITYRIDSSNKIDWKPSVKITHSTSDNMDTVGIITTNPQTSYLSADGITQNKQTTDDISIGNSISLFHRFHKKRRNLVVSLSQTHDDQTITGSLKNNLSLSSHVDQHFRQTTSGNHYGADLSYAEPLSAGHVFDFHYSIAHDQNLSLKKSYAYNPLTGSYDLADTLTTNDFTNNNTEQRLGAGYNVTGKHTSYQLGIAAQFSTLESINHTKGTDLSQSLVNWFPRASMNYAIAKGTSLRMEYTGSSVSPTLEQLQPLPDLSNPFLVKTGNPALQQQFTHNLLLNYTHTNFKNFSSLLVSLNGMSVENKIVPSTVILAGGIQQVQYVNVNGAYALGSMLTYGFPLGDRKHGNGKIKTALNYARDISFVNGEQNTRKNTGVLQGVSLNYNYGDRLFVELNANLSYTYCAYSISQGLSTELFTQLYGTDISYALPFGATLSTNYSLNITGPQTGLPGNQSMIWNASLSKNLLRNKSVECKLSAFDLLNSNTGFMQTSGANYIETSTNNILNQLFIVSFTYHFKKVSA